jgi:hypothetical protein
MGLQGKISPELTLRIRAVLDPATGGNDESGGALEETQEVMACWNNGLKRFFSHYANTPLFHYSS